MTPNFFPIAYFDSQFRPFGEANVSIATHALQYGSGVFGGMRGYVSHDGQSIAVFRLGDHVARFGQSASLLGISIPLDADALVNTVLELVARNKPTTDIYVRPFAYKSGLDVPPGMLGVADGLAIFMVPLGRLYGEQSPGLSVKVSTWRRVEDTAIPARGKISGAYVNSSLAKDEAIRLGFDDAILLNEDGSVAEASTCNIFMVRHNTLITPPVSDNVLEGITRRSLMQLAADLGISVVERSIDRTELYVADEIIFCGTAVELTKVSQIDGREVGGSPESPLFDQLSQQFGRLVRGQLPQYGDWLSVISDESGNMEL